MGAFDGSDGPVGRVSPGHGARVRPFLHGAIGVADNDSIGHVDEDPDLNDPDQPPERRLRDPRRLQRFVREEVEDLVAVVRPERARPRDLPALDAIAQRGRLPFDHRNRERDDLDRNGGALPERRDQLPRINQNHDLVGKTGENLFPEERATAPLREVERRTDLIRPVQHEVEAVVAPELTDGDPEGTGELLGRAGARHAVESSLGIPLGQRSNRPRRRRAGPQRKAHPGPNETVDSVPGRGRLRPVEIAPIAAHASPGGAPAIESGERQGEYGPVLPPRRMPKASRSSPAPVVLSIGGSVLWTGEDDRRYWGDLADLLRRLGTEFPLLVTTGGGRTAREYIQLGRALGLTEVELDEIGIEVTRLHARLLAARVGPPSPARPPTTVAEAIQELRHSSPVILGGTEPGHTTDGVAALLAVRARASRLVNATNVTGIYERDPRADPSARRRDRLRWPEFRAMVEAGTTTDAGQNFLFDRLGAELLARAKIPLRVVHGRDLANLEAAARGSPFVGSQVDP